MDEWKKHNGVDALSRMSGLSKDRVHEIWNDVKVNIEKLKGCDGHRFGEIGGDGRPSERCICKNCGGTMTVMAIITYGRGYEHAGGNLSDVYKMRKGDR